MQFESEHPLQTLERFQSECNSLDDQLQQIGTDIESERDIVSQRHQQFSEDLESFDNCSADVVRKQIQLQFVSALSSNASDSNTTETVVANVVHNGASVCPDFATLDKLTDSILNGDVRNEILRAHQDPIAAKQTAVSQVLDQLQRALEFNAAKSKLLVTFDAQIERLNSEVNQELRKLEELQAQREESENCIEASVCVLEELKQKVAAEKRKRDAFNLLKEEYQALQSENDEIESYRANLKGRLRGTPQNKSTVNESDVSTQQTTDSEISSGIHYKNVFLRKLSKNR
jgi:chromosome segregation ATPase